MNDYYKILGLANGADSAAIKAAFRRLAREYHPDRNPSPEASRKFLEIKEAYEVLISPERREVYDRYRGAKFEGSNAQAQTEAQPSAKERDRAKEAFFRHRQRVEQMQRYARAGRWGDASDLAREIITERNEAIAYAVLADAARIEGNFPEAAKQYAFALQFDQTNEDYHRLHVAMLEASRRKKGSLARDPAEKNPAAFMVGVLVVGAAIFYTALVPDPVQFESVGIISTWGVIHVMMLAIAGMALGASLAASDLLDHFDMGGGAAGYRLHPGVVAAFLSLINFWLAAGIYLLVGFSQRSFNTSVTRLVGFTSLTVVLFAWGRWGQGSDAALQTMIHGGGIVYLCSLFGWFTADAIRRVI